MARTPKRPAAPRASTASASTNGKPARERAISAFMELLAEKPFEEIGYADVAGRAGVSLAELRDLFGSKLEILAAQIKEVDRQVLAGGESPNDMADEPPRERLFDVLMRRLDVLAPHKPALRSLMRSARRNPGLALALNRLGVRSQQWMLTAADISATGPKGALRAQGLALLFASVLRTWLDDEDPGLARTMSALDRALARGQRLVGLLDEVARIPACVCRLRPGSRRRRRDAEEDTDTVAA
jgi:AcrR family transcriptional regulator